MEKLLSIIIPTYNMERYLPKCLDSLIIEEHLMSQLDIIVVNDGSKDASSEIAHTYKKRFPNSITVIDKENGNYGSCINAGLKVATGKYIRVLDSDDSYDNQNFQLFVEQLAHVNVDLVVSNCIVVNDNNCILGVHKFKLDANKVYVLHEYEGESIDNSNITYNRNIFNGLDYHQTEGISYTDTEWMIIPMLNVETMIYLDLDIYRYLVGRDGQTTENNTFVKRIHQLIPIMKTILNKIASKDEQCSPYLDSIIMQKLTLLYRTILFFGDASQVNLLHDFDEALKRKFNRYYSELSKLRLEKIPYRYVQHWRKSKILSRFIRKVNQIYQNNQ